VHAEIEHATAAGQASIAAPRFVGPVRVVELQVYREQLAELAGRESLAQLAHAPHVSIAEVHGEQAIRCASCCYDAGGCSCISSERLLTENRDAALQTGECLLGVTGVRRCDDDAVDTATQQRFKIARNDRARVAFRGRCRAIRSCICQSHDLDQGRLRDGIEPFASDPAQSEKSQPDRCGPSRAGKIRLRAHRSLLAPTPS
jgi:hypothetical protein